MTEFNKREEYPIYRISPDDKGTLTWINLLPCSPLSLLDLYVTFYEIYVIGEFVSCITREQQGGQPARAAACCTRLLSGVTSGRGQRTQGRWSLSCTRQTSLWDVIHVFSLLFGSPLNIVFELYSRYPIERPRWPNPARSWRLNKPSQHLNTI